MYGKSFILGDVVGWGGNLLVREDFLEEEVCVEFWNVSRRYLGKDGVGVGKYKGVEGWEVRVLYNMDTDKEGKRGMDYMCFVLVRRRSFW